VTAPLEAAALAETLADSGPYVQGLSTDDAEALRLLASHARETEHGPLVTMVETSGDEEEDGFAVRVDGAELPDVDPDAALDPSSEWLFNLDFVANLARALGASVEFRRRGAPPIVRAALNTADGRERQAAELDAWRRLAVSYQKIAGFIEQGRGRGDAVVTWHEYGPAADAKDVLRAMGIDPATGERAAGDGQPNHPPVDIRLTEAELDGIIDLMDRVIFGQRPAELGKANAVTLAKLRAARGSR
jgi:hypothetical protein